MWLPDSVYNRAPHYWLVLGLLFIVVGSYMGFEFSAIYFYVGIGVGVACCAWSLHVFSRRARHRRSGEMDADPSPADS